MKAERFTRRSCSIPSALAIVGALAFVGGLLTAAGAQSDSLVVSSGELQRLVYSAHVASQMGLKPELEAGLRVLLELQRRNPNSSPSALAELSRQALQRYRTTAPVQIRKGGFQDEILAAYLEALRQVPGFTNVRPATLQLVSGLMLQPPDYSTASPAELVHSANRRLLASVGGPERRRQLLESCTRRAQEQPAFALSMDDLLVPETLVSIFDPPASIIGNTNSPLHGNPTFQTLLTLSASSGNGSATVTSNLLHSLFKTEADTLWGIIHTNLARRQEFNLTHPDLLAYLTNSQVVAEDKARSEQLRETQARQIACSSAAVLVQSALVEHHPLVELPEGVEQLGDGLCALADIVGGIADKNPGDVLSGAFDLFNVMTGQESADDQIVREVGNVKILLGDLSTNMNYRFDRIDKSLVTIFDTMNDEFGKLKIELDAQKGWIVRLDGDMQQARRNLLNVNADLHRLERNVSSYLSELDGRGFKTELNRYLGYEAKFGVPMSYNTLPVPYYVFGETEFFTHARDHSIDELGSPYLGRDYTPSGLLHELTESSNSGGSVSNRLDQNLNYIKKFLNDRLAQPTVGEVGQIANPRDWFVGAFAYTQLAVENPMYFRRVNPQAGIDLVAARGRDLTNFLRSLTFTGSSINWPLQNAVQNYYVQKMTNFTEAVRSIEQDYATDRGFALDSWRRWLGTVPRRAAGETRVVVTPEGYAAPRQGAVAGSSSHLLMLQQDGTVLGRAFSGADYTPGPVSPEATNVVAIAAGYMHDIALRADGSVLVWGHPEAGEILDVPPGLGDVRALSAGYEHSLALKQDGTVVGWGRGPNTDIPSGLTNVEAIATSSFYRVPIHSLALLGDGTVVGWGDNWHNQADGSLAGTGNIAIAAGSGHSLALKTNGAVIGWGNSEAGQITVPPDATNVIAIAAGQEHSVALRADGTVLAWGYNRDGQTDVPPDLRNVVGIAAGDSYCLAIQADGEVVAWGRNFSGITPIPRAVTNVVSISAGYYYNLALRSDGTVVGWGDNDYGQAKGAPASATNLVAISAGYRHSLGLRSDGTVVGWGDNYFGQANGAAAGLNIIAIAAGYDDFSLALCADGSVVAWGAGWNGVTDVPVSATNAVSIRAGAYHGLALRADGKVVGWGSNWDGKATGVPGGPSGLVQINGQVLDNVVAIEAGDSSSLAIKSDGSLVSWPGGTLAGNHVAISAKSHSMALRADGSVVAWGGPGAPAAATNVIALSCGWKHGLFLTQTGVPNSAGEGTRFIALGELPVRARTMLDEVYGMVVTNLDLDLHSSAIEMSGAKALLSAVAELSLPHTLERDDVLRGFLYGSDCLADLDTARVFLESEWADLGDMPTFPGPYSVADVAVLRYLRFSERYAARLNDLAAEGRPELPRLVAHTLRLLQSMRDSWGPPPPPVLELRSESNALRLTLYGEPSVGYQVLCCDHLNEPIWQSILDLRNEETVAPPLSGGLQRFYQAVLPTP